MIRVHRLRVVMQPHSGGPRTPSAWSAVGLIPPGGYQPPLKDLPDPQLDRPGPVAAGEVAYGMVIDRSRQTLPGGASPPEFHPVTRDYLLPTEGRDSGAKPLISLCAGAHREN